MLMLLFAECSINFRGDFLTPNLGLDLSRTNYGFKDRCLENVPTRHSLAVWKIASKPVDTAVQLERLNRCARLSDRVVGVFELPLKQTQYSLVTPHPPPEHV
ncbi:hypothetical protein J6590_024123 [Homalodisca vitripennis]|nr:hypothetical protein J6590_024123 [Homalodisca vitripennis]